MRRTRSKLTPAATSNLPMFLGRRASREGLNDGLWDCFYSTRLIADGYHGEPSVYAVSVVKQHWEART